MLDYDLSNVEVVVVDSQLHAVRLVREMLNRLGIKKVELFDSVDQALSFMTGSAPDLVLIDCEGPLESDAFRMVRSIRNDMTVQNPYTGIVITVWQATQNHVLKMTNAGADAMLVKPFSPRQILDRIGTLVDSRKNFVVTSDFVGPDRRKHPREGTQIPLFDVPNTLAMKVLGRPEQHEARPLIVAANETINAQKCLRAGVQVGFLIEYAAPGLASSPIDRWAVDHVARVPAVLDDLERRLGDDLRRAAIPVCREVREKAAQVIAAAETGAVGKPVIDGLRETARRLMSALDSERPIEAIVHEVKTAAAAYAVRLEAMTQAKAASSRAE